MCSQKKDWQPTANPNFVLNELLLLLVVLLLFLLFEYI